METISKIEELESRVRNLHNEIKQADAEVTLLKMKALSSFKGTKADKVIRIAEYYFGLSLEQMSDKTSVREICQPRQMLITLLRKHGDASLRRVGILLDRDHSSISHSLKAIRNARDTKDPLYDRYLDIESLVVKTLNA